MVMLPELRLVPVVVKLCADEAVPVTVLNPERAFVEVLIEGTPAWSIVKVCALDTEAPVATVIDAVPADVMFAAGTLAVSCVAETKVVVSGVPFHRTAEPPVKLVPLTVNVKAPDPDTLEVGDNELMYGVATVTLILS